ncbi:hypothetical protein ACVOMT_03940 [Sphingomonas panni]
MISSTVRSALLGAVSIIGLAAPDAAFAQTGTGNTPAATATPADAAAAPTQVDGGGDDIVVTGIRASQARSVEIKRNAASVVEAISAQDIGKLPDVTISDLVAAHPRCADLAARRVKAARSTSAVCRRSRP